VSATATVPAPGAIRTPADRFVRAARTIEPVLTRVVFAGPAAVELLIDDPGVRVTRLNFAADSVFQLLSASMVDRLGHDLEKLGFTRIARTEGADRWRGAGDVTLDLVQVRTDGETPSQLCLEYATLLTRPVAPDDCPAARMASAPALLAIDCAAFAAGIARALESEALERVVRLIAGHRKIEEECGGAPAELRSVITPVLAMLAASDALQLLIRRALPDTAMLPALATRVRDRIVRMAR
jgi:hypothetical protein